MAAQRREQVVDRLVGYRAVAHGSGRSHWLLLIPAVALLLIAPPALGASAAVASSPVQVVPRDSPAAAPKQWPFPPLPTDPAPNAPVVDLVNRALLDSNHSLDGREVTISGFVICPKDLEQRHPDTTEADLARVVITCCVADARYVRVSNQIGAEVQPPQHGRGCEGRVDGQQRTISVRDLGQCGDLGYAEIRIGDGRGVNQPGVGAHDRPYGVEVGDVDEINLDTEFGR